MPDNALTLIQAKIAEIEAKLGKLKTAEGELKKLVGGSGSVSRSTEPVRARRGRPPMSVKPEAAVAAEPKTSVTSQIRTFLSENSPSSATVISEGIGVDTRPISFALQALKRKGEVKMKDGEWSMNGRRRKTA